MQDARVLVTREVKDSLKCYGVLGKDMGISLRGKKRQKIQFGFNQWLKERYYRISQNYKLKLLIFPMERMAEIPQDPLEIEGKSDVKFKIFVRIHQPNDGVKAGDCF